MSWSAPAVPRRGITQAVGCLLEGDEEWTDWECESEEDEKSSKGYSNSDDCEKVISVKNNGCLMSTKVKKAKDTKTSTILLRILGGVMLVGTVYLWHSMYSTVPWSGLVMICGVVMAGIFKIVFPAGFNPSSRIQRNIALTLTVVIILMSVNQLTFAYATMFLFGLLSAIYLFGVVRALPNSNL